MWGGGGGGGWWIEGMKLILISRDLQKDYFINFVFFSMESPIIVFCQISL